MTRGLLVVAAFVSIVFFPWPFAALLALVASVSIPLLPLAAGLFADTLYYAPHAGAVPLFTLCGAALTVAAFFVRSWLSTSIIKG